MSAPVTPLGARTPHAHPAFAPVIAVLAAAAAVGIYLAVAYLQGWWPLAHEPSESLSPSPSASASPSLIEYRNKEYGFAIKLPGSWRGFTTGYEVQTAFRLDDSEQTEKFGRFSVIHPKSTAQAPRQDIPVMVFTHDQWARIQQEKLSVGAAPIPPSELAYNSQYVFALPARYNYAFPEGWEEVEEILKDNPVSAFEPASSSGPVDGPLTDGWLPFSSRYFTLSFKVPPGYSVGDEQNWVGIAQGSVGTSELGGANVFMTIERYTGSLTRDKAMADFRQASRDVRVSTITVDGSSFTRMDGTDNASNGRRFAVFFDRSVLRARESGLGQTPDYLAISENILASFRFSK